ncbi:metallophosphoesterase [Granulicella sp. dw_53]|uniref:metallophosphoesterase n=1 Tax=Granulicella sp. dw_53 TaxID=2719792 RepID=UPI001BD4BAD4|nr:metallophosphoesterase [Granulicella sp. dw_53]
MEYTIDTGRRAFLRQSFAFSALAALGARTGFGLQTPADPKAKHILMVGDWGWEEDVTAQARVARSMVSYAKHNSLKTEALLMLGDSWYGPMPHGVDDLRWKVQFEDMYPKSAFDCPAYSVMGNHDYQKMPDSKVDIELAYARKPGTRWTQPALWYTYEFPKKNPLMTVIALDSNMPMGHKDDGVNFTLTPAQQAEQLAWFTAELEKPRTTPFLVVIAHHPVFSNGPHGDHQVLIKEWEPLLQKHKVHLYLAGHDHDLQHLEFEGHPTSFVSSGAGGADLYTLKIAESARGPYAQKVYGFSHLEVTPEKLTLRHIDAEGKLVHAFSKTPDGTITVGA